jgi:hypothetical protein
MYYRIDLDMDSFGTDVFEVFDHANFNYSAGTGGLR